MESGEVTVLPLLAAVIILQDGKYAAGVAYISGLPIPASLRAGRTYNMTGDIVIDGAGTVPYYESIIQAGGNLMATFIMAMNINSDAKKVHPDLSHQINESLDVFSKNKVKILNLYATLGRYDYIAIFDAGDQTIAFQVASEINSRGVLETETWPVISYDDFSRLI